VRAGQRSDPAKPSKLANFAPESGQAGAAAADSPDLWSILNSQNFSPFAKGNNYEGDLAYDRQRDAACQIPVMARLSLDRREQSALRSSGQEAVRP